jgi:hypothetical protein
MLETGDARTASSALYVPEMPDEESAIVRAKELLTTCWLRHSPNPFAAVQAFVDEMAAINPTAAAVLGRRFVSGMKEFANQRSAIREAFEQVQPRVNPPLTTTIVAKAAPGEYRDGTGNLYLHVRNGGGRVFEHHYQDRQNQRSIAIGSADKMPLNEARAKAATIRKQQDKGIDPFTTRMNWLRFGGLRINGRRIAECTTEEALAWCENMNRDTSFVRALCRQIPDPRKPIGEQVTQDMIEVAAASAET